MSSEIPLLKHTFLVITKFNCRYFSFRPTQPPMIIIGLYRMREAEKDCTEMGSARYSVKFIAKLTT